MEGPFTRETLPLALPSGLAVRQTRTEDGFRDDPVAVRQLEIIGRLLREADGAVTATDTSREGQLVARNLYDYLGFKGKTERLWLSSLTDDAIREAFLDLRPDSLYEGLYLAGRARREADRIIGYNASSRSAWRQRERTTRSDGTDTGARPYLAPLPEEQGFQRRTLLPAGAVGPQGR